MNINLLINELLTYSLDKTILSIEDFSYTVNVLIDLFNQKEFIEETVKIRDIDSILSDLSTYAFDNKIIDSNDVVTVDNFKAKLIDVLIDKPKEVIRKFNLLKDKNPNQATDYLYKLAIDTNYIQTKRIKQNIEWSQNTDYGKIGLTINLSKPEKDPKLIALQMTKKSGYPKCQLCKENEGYRGHLSYDSRSNMRIIPLKLNNEDWYFQYSPYSYFNEHSIVLNKEHNPMVINKGTFIKLLDFLDEFPEYFIGSNAGLPIVGGSILNHEHYQSGKYHFPIESARADLITIVDEVEVYKVNWPLSTVRIKSENRAKLIDFATHIFDSWQDYQNVDLLIVNTKEEIHNTITPISRKENEKYVFDLILRNNYTTNEFPDGVFHPHPSRHNIKKENIGLIEAMGLGILPPRLKVESELIAKYLEGNTDILNDKRLEKHLDWIKEIEVNYNPNTDTFKFLLEEIGKVFSNVLKDAGVFKMDNIGQEALSKFIESLV